MNRRSASVNVSLWLFSSFAFAFASDPSDFVWSSFLSKKSAFAQSVSGKSSGAYVSATRAALAQSSACAYMSMASLGLSASMNATSASAYLPSSSKKSARFKYTSLI